MSDDILLLANNLSFFDEVYARYQRDPGSVDDTWRQLFSNGHAAAGRAVAGAVTGGSAPSAAPPVAAVAPGLGPSIWPLVNAYRVRGHMVAHLDPLELMERPPHPELEPATYGIRPGDMDRPGSSGGLHGVDRATPRQVLEHLQRTYCGTIGLEFMHISTPAKKAWLASRMETSTGGSSDEVRIAMLEKLVGAETFELFLHRKYPGTKRFSLEGSESLIPLLEQVLDHVGRLGALEAVIGMAHRGRLCVLREILHKPARELFAEFDDIDPEATLGGGDVKYHLGYSCDRVSAQGHRMHLSLAFNPSHLEAVNPVVVGRVRAKQRRHHDWEHTSVCGVLIHGDAAFAGQGVVPETLNLSNLHGYKTGGTVHIIVNNQIGFTSSPTESRSTPYCTDVAKMIQCPIFHVNGEDLDAVARVCEMAAEYRAQFQSDVVIDMFCYRKYGHNEMDEPAFTQPVMYRRINGRQGVGSQYAARLLADGVLAQAELDAMRERARIALDAELEAARRSDTRPIVESMGGVWEGYVGGADAAVPDEDTAVPADRLAEVALGATAVPEDFSVHPKIGRLFEQRRAMGRGERPVDWAMGELLAFGTVLRDGINLRLSGQDSSRGTFSQRHAIVTDVQTGAEYSPLAHLSRDQGDCCIYDSPLSEAGVLGFEFGYSLDYPDALVIWEAQFGDFANGAQTHLDVFLCSCEDKWNRLSGLTLFLPHGFEGQGPEHSSARLERLLQNCAEDNWQIVQPTTPAQQFHLLRRQVHRPLRKPLVVLTPKSLLRLPAAVSDLGEFTSGQFKRVYDDPMAPPADQVERIMLCSGRVYYDLVETRAQREDGATALVRLEQLYPWPERELADLIARYRNLERVAWVQDEPTNMGAWTFVRPRLAKALGARKLRRFCREASASPATGSHKAHAIEQRRLLDAAFDWRD